MDLTYQAMSKSKKLLHIGANTGQEAKLYHDLGLKAWHIEAIPDIYEQMKENLRFFNNQIPLNYCLSSHPDESIEFHIANNGGQSSSMLEIGRHASAYPMVKYTHSIQLRTSTVDKLVAEGIIDSDIDFLLIDAQGAELKILQGADSLLSSGAIRYALIEVAIRPIYEGGASFIEVVEHLEKHGLFLRHASFNDKGWTDALLETQYWPIKPPSSAIPLHQKNIAPLAMMETSSACVIPTPLSMSGETSGTYCFHTEKEFQPWLKISFQDPVHIDEIVIFNRCEAATERAYDLNIYHSLHDSDWNLLHENHAPFGGVDWPGPLSIKANLSVKYLLFRLRTENFFHLDQVMILASANSNILPQCIVD
jgi:FkbM family methyltransferase